MHVHNTGASMDARLQYPDGIKPRRPLPLTKGKFDTLSGIPHSVFTNCSLTGGFVEAGCNVSLVFLGLPLLRQVCLSCDVGGRLWTILVLELISTSPV